MSFRNLNIPPLDPGPYGDVKEKISSITEAIETFLLLEFDYNDLARIVEPYELGVSKDGYHLLRCYQIGGESSHKRINGWKIFRLDYMSSVEVSDVDFIASQEYYELSPEWTHLVIKKI
jgi:hypothetical protein